MGIIDFHNNLLVVGNIVMAGALKLNYYRNRVTFPLAVLRLPVLRIS
jgi:hypothetical protein